MKSVASNGKRRCTYNIVNEIQLCNHLVLNLMKNDALRCNKQPTLYCLNKSLRGDIRVHVRDEVRKFLPSIYCIKQHIKKICKNTICQCMSIFINQFFSIIINKSANILYLNFVVKEGICACALQRRKFHFPNASLCHDDTVN